MMGMRNFEKPQVVSVEGRGCSMISTMNSSVARKKILTAVAAVPITLALALGVFAAPQAQAATKTFTPSITKLTPTSVLEGGTIKVSGKVTPASKAKNTKVTIQVKKSGSSSYKTVKTVKLSSAGKFSSVKVKVSGVGTWYYRLCKPAGNGYKAKCTAGKKVVVKAKVFAPTFTVADATLTQGEDVVISGKVTPVAQAKGAKVTIQVRPDSSSTYTTVKTVALSSSATFSGAKVATEGQGAWYYRVCKAAGSGYKAKCAAGKKVTVGPKTVTTYQDYPVQFTNSSSLPAGQTQVTQKGVRGTTVQTFKAGSVVSTVVTAPVGEKVTVGTGTATTNPAPTCTSAPKLASPTTSSLQGGGTATITGCDLQNVASVDFLSWYYTNPMVSVYDPSTGGFVNKRVPTGLAINNSLWPVPGRNLKITGTSSLTVTIPANLAETADVRVKYSNGTYKTVGQIVYSTAYSPKSPTAAQTSFLNRLNAIRAKGVDCNTGTIKVDSKGNVTYSSSVHMPPAPALTFAPKLSDLATAVANDVTQRPSVQGAFNLMHTWPGTPDATTKFLVAMSSNGGGLESTVNLEDGGGAGGDNLGPMGWTSDTGHCATMMDPTGKYAGIGLSYGTGDQNVQILEVGH